MLLGMSVLCTPLHGLGTSQHQLHLPLADQPKEHKCDITCGVGWSRTHGGFLLHPLKMGDEGHENYLRETTWFVLF